MLLSGHLMNLEAAKTMKMYRIINPCDRVIDLKEIKNDTMALAWLNKVQAAHRDTFLELQTRAGRSWVTLDTPPRMTKGFRYP